MKSKVIYDEYQDDILGGNYYGGTRNNYSEMKIVKIGCGQLPKRMTKKQAYNYGKRNMPKHLKQIGFDVIVFESDIEINGGDFYRISYGKIC